MSSKFQFNTAWIDTTLYITSTGANLLNKPLKLNDKNHQTITKPLELMFITKVVNHLDSFPEILKMLENLCVACGIKEGQSQLFEIGISDDYKLGSDLDTYTRRVLFFDVSPNELHLNISLTKYIPAVWANVKFIACDDLQTLLSDKTARKTLWENLKIEFNIG